MHSFQQLLLLVLAIFYLTLLSFPIQTATRKSPMTYYNCTRNSTFPPNSAYQHNINTLLDWLSSNGSRIARFYNTTVAGKNSADTVYGLFLCTRRINIKICQECVTEAAKLISTVCPMAKEAIVWHKICFVRYSNRCFFSTVEVSPKLSFTNDLDYKGQIGHFNNILWDMMNDLRTGAASTSEKSAYMSVNITDNQTLYGSAWCVPNLSADNCRWCLSDAIAEIPTSCCRGKSGGRVIYPSCGVRFELYPFFDASTGDSQPAPALSPPPTLAGKRKQQKLIIFEVVVSVVTSVVLLTLCCFCFLRRRERKNQEDVLKESFGNNITTLESIRFNLAEIEAATNKFSKENKIGKGGFGEVYKGILLDGQEIAVKRLIGSSGQGVVEFKNEVLVIAKLQHRNLVSLLGFCLEREEKILIYEYVPNKSLDYFLLDLQKQRQLSWSERYKIIRGIARGILYLHEDSCLKIIHRDLKPSNVLLDSKMNLKISDFGMARIVAADQIEENTGRIVGTYGYMSPEYAMYGQFSVKSDVFSFGIMVLEIISGKRKSYSNESECFNDIRRYVLTKWTNQKPLELLDSTLEGSYSQEEVIKCIQIGLLCVQEDLNNRPTMATIVFYLNSPLANLPLPPEPTFFKHKGEQHKMPSLDKISYSFSINEVSLTTKFSPR